VCNILDKREARLASLKAAFSGVQKFGTRYDVA